MTTLRLVLRRPKSSDAAAKYAYARDPEVARYMEWIAHTSERDAVAFIEGAISRWDSGEEYSWVIMGARGVTGRRVELGHRW